MAGTVTSIAIAPGLESLAQELESLEGEQLLERLDARLAEYFRGLLGHRIGKQRVDMQLLRRIYHHPHLLMEGLRPSSQSAASSGARIVHSNQPAAPLLSRPAPGPAALQSTSSPKPEYKHYFVHAGAQNEHTIKVYATPSAIPGETPVVLFLPSTELEEPPVDVFHGGEMVYVPQVQNYGKSKWMNDIPNWLPGWIASMQHDHPRVEWSVVGCSRGAAWAAKIATASGVTFREVVLVAPYLLPDDSPRRDSPEKKTPVHTRLETMLPEYKHRLLIVFGENDDWGTPDRGLYNDASTQLIRHIRPHCCDGVIPGANHKKSLRPAAKEYWPGTPPIQCVV